MPFKRSARLTINNLGRKPSQHWFEVNYRSYARAPKDQGYFHAQYRQGMPPPVGAEVCSGTQQPGLCSPLVQERPLSVKVLHQR